MNRISDFESYTQEALQTAIFKPEYRLFYPALGLAGETGEVLEKIKKLFRDQNGIADDAFILSLTKELGDVLWYLTVLAHQFDVSLEEIATRNIEKLRERQKNGKLQGNGDNR